MSNFNFEEMNKKLDNLLENETKENVIKWLENKHKDLVEQSEVGVEKLVIQAATPSDESGVRFDLKKELEEFLGGTDKYSDIWTCMEQISCFRRILTKGQMADKHLESAEKYLRILYQLARFDKKYIEFVITQIGEDLSRFSV